VTIGAGTRQVHLSHHSRRRLRTPAFGRVEEGAFDLDPALRAGLLADVSLDFVRDRLCGIEVERFAIECGNCFLE
jgi:hypothetical protein